MEKVIVLLGQTAVGKTSLSLSLAKLLNGEIINGDAMQVYKGLDIVTAKINKQDMEDIPHHLFSFKNIKDDYSVEEHQKNIREVITQITSRGHLPIIVGGTGLYIKAAIYDYEFNTQKVSNIEFEEKYSSYSNEKLYEYLSTIDPSSAKQIHQNNRRRVLRAIEIFESTGISKSQTIAMQEHKQIYDCIFFGLTLPKDKLISNINLRVDNMVENGLIEEIKTHPCNSTASKAIGYKEINSYLENQITLNEAIELIKIHTRQYAKRQMTWMKNQLPMIFIENDDKALNSICEIIKSKFNM